MASMVGRLIAFSFLVPFFLSIFSCSQEREAKTQFAILRLNASSGKIEEVIPALERFLAAFADTRTATEAKDELAYIQKIWGAKLDEIDQAAGEIGKSAVEIAGEKVEPKETLKQFHQQAEKAIEPGIIADKARRQLEALFALAKRFHLSARCYYIANACFSTNFSNYGFDYDRARYALDIIPFERNKIGYQKYNCEVRDDRHPAFMNVTSSGEFKLTVKVKEYAQKLLKEE
jgi:hypothetical protein